ncbi:MAG: MarC family protein [Sphingobacteriia bacterium]|nr:MarC family protein [Sphingobacteriia bacterium]
MNEHFPFLALAFTTFLTIINPLSVMPMFLTMTEGLDPSERKRVAWKAVLTAFLTMVFFAFTGNFIFDFFQITANGFRVAGGIIFFIIGYDMLQARYVRIRVKKKEIRSYVTDVSVTPLGIPMICGPGAITNSILLMQQAKGSVETIILISMMAFIALLTFVVLLGSQRLSKFLGETGNKVMMRIMGLIVMVIAIEFFFSGLKPIVIEIIRQGVQP